LTIEKFFDILKDGEWHDLTEISDQIEVQTSKLIEFTLFLTQQGIISYEDKTQRIKIKTEWQDAFPDEN
jgi:DNA-binding IclR family transcriptional regulator